MYFVCLCIDFYWDPEIRKTQKKKGEKKRKTKVQIE